MCIVTRSTARKSGPKDEFPAFVDLARSIEADEDEARWEERLRKIATHKPTPEQKEMDGGC